MQSFNQMASFRSVAFRTFVSCALLGSALSFAPAASAQKKASGEVPIEVEITEKARKHFRAGVAFVEDPDGARYADALREFKLAYAESPSWKILGNLGLAALKLERDGEAIEALKTYLAEGGDQVDPDERKQFQRDIDALEASVTWVTISSNQPGALLTDRRSPLAGDEKVNLYEMAAEPVRIGLHAGRHKITASLEGYEPVSWTFDASGGELSHEFNLVEVKKEEKVAPGPEPAEPVDDVVTTRPVPVSVWIGAGVTGALAIGATVTGIMATNKHSQFESANDGTDVDKAESLKNSGQTLNLVTDVMLGGAVVGAVVTTVLYVMRPEVKSTESALKFTPVALPSGGGAFIHGKF